MNFFRRLALVILLLNIVVLLGSWGFLVHRTVHQLAVYELPKGLQNFFFQNVEYLVANAPRADNRRNSDSTEASKHFIDMEAYGTEGVDGLPLHWSEAVQKYTLDTLLKYGYVPYHILYMKDQLVTAFKTANRDSILFYAADLAHYIEDANVPLHTSVNYDGQLTNQRGLHSLWESMIPEIEITNYNLYSRHRAKYLKHPERDVMKAIKRSNSLLSDVFAKEKKVSALFTDSTKYRVQIRNGKEYKNYTSDFAKAYAASLKNTINDQIKNSANMVADFWYTSWVDAGSPDLSNLNSTSFMAEDKKALKRELKAFKKNKLISDSLLIARKQVGDKRTVE